MAKRDNLGAFVADVQKRGARAMTQALVLGSSEASALTPIDTGTLLNSQFRKVTKEGDSVVGTAGYTASYALPVHDPSVKQTFRRSSATKEFLRKGFERAEPRIQTIIVGSLRK